MGRGADPSITNKNGDSGISLSAIKNLSKILKFFYETNPKWLDYEHETNKSNLAFLAVKHFSYEVLELLMELKPDLFNVEYKDFTPLYFCLSNQVMKLDVAEAIYENEGHKNDEVKKSKSQQLKYPLKENQTVTSMVDLMLRKCDPIIFKKTIGKFGSILHMLIRLNHFEGSQILVQRFKDQPILQEIFDSKIFDSKTNDGLSPLYFALQKTEGFQTGKSLTFN